MIPPVAAPWLFLVLFIAASFLMIWRLESMTENGVEGTVLGTLIMPYCSGMGNLIFALVVGVNGIGDSAEVVTNSLVNNTTNITLLIGLPTLLWGARWEALPPSAPTAAREAQRSARADLLLTLAAVFVFTGVAALLARDGRFDFEDGFVLVGMFLFWQAYHLFDLLRTIVGNRKASFWLFVIDLTVLAMGSFAVYISTDWLVGWVAQRGEGFLSSKHLGWLSGWLMILPNGLLALYYGWKRRADILYASQVGDGHICIPLCLGLVALYRPMTVPAFFNLSTAIIIGTTLVHFLFVAFAGGLPRMMGWLLLVAYGVFVYIGIAR